MSSNSNKRSPPAGGSTSGSNGGSQTGGVKSKYTMVKDGWGTRQNFQLSMGLGLDPEGFEEGNRILDSFQEADREWVEEARKAGQSSRK